MTSNNLVTIKKNVYPDVQVVVSQKKYNDELEYILVSFVKSECLLIEEECTEEGIPNRNSYKEPKYHACRLTDDIIEVCDPKIGWIPAAEQLNEAYAGQLAEKALLGEKHG